MSIKSIDLIEPTLSAYLSEKDRCVTATATGTASRWHEQMETSRARRVDELRRLGLHLLAGRRHCSDTSRWTVSQSDWFAVLSSHCPWVLWTWPSARPTHLHTAPLNTSPPLVSIAIIDNNNYRHTYVFDYNSDTSWLIFILFIPM